MRLFIALNLPKKERERIYRAARCLREEEMPVRWLEPDHFHVTLKFLGEIRRERVPQVEEAIARVAETTAPFSTTLSGFGAFPTIRRPRVIWLGVGANPELRCLKQDIEWSLGDLGFEAETRAFHPHVTLGRANDRNGAGAFRGLDDMMAELEFKDDVKVHSLDLMRSQVSREGAKYTVLSSAKLAS
ncbi:MAG TPA: RNA 2',3'-cyclic phosphodiesterase [Longimicrobiales bacterium]|nr:RNA 2',3'-cyclic phosphodiesterase [Longimicrobiales bacterium]